jgi:hypothetical protein
MGSAIGASMTKRSMDQQNKLLAEAQGRQMWAEKEAENKKAAEAKNLDMSDAVNTQKKKKGVQSTFVAVSGGSGTSVNGALTPVGG